MKPRQNPALWTSTILHLVVFAGLLLATLIEALLPKETPHVFEMVSAPTPDERPKQESLSTEPLPDFRLPEVQPLEIPEPPPVHRPQPVQKKTPVSQPVAPTVAPEKSVEPLMSYEDFLKKNKIKQPKTQNLPQNRPKIKVPVINTEQFGVKLQSSLTTTDARTSQALTTLEQTALQRYGSLLNSRLNKSWTKPSALSGVNLVVTVVFDVSRSGRISNIRFSQSSGNASFDESVRAAFAQVGSAGETPTGQDHTFTMSFKMVH